jgi:hypothetical protein
VRHARRWCSAVGLTIALATPLAAQRGDTLSIFPEIRSAQWIASAPGVLQRSFVGDLHVALVRAADDGTMTPLKKADLAPMRLTEARAFAIAIRNSRTRLVPFASGIPEPSSELSGMYSIEGMSIETSRLLLQDDWRELEARLGGPIVAVAPHTGSLLFGRDTIVPISRRKSVPATQFLELAADVLTPYGKRDDALSTTVLRFTPQGWRVVPLMTVAERRELNRKAPEASDVDTAPAASVTATPPAVKFPPPTTAVQPVKPSKAGRKPAKP